MTLFRSSDRDLEQLSAYLDGQLPPAARSRLERRLARDPQLQKTFDELRAVKTRLSQLPAVEPPRSFTLTPAMVGASARRSPSLLPALYWATAVAAVLFAVVIAGDLLGALAAPGPQALAPAPAAGLALEAAPTSAPAESLAAQAEAPAATADATQSATPTSSAERSQQAPAAVTHPALATGGATSSPEPTTPTVASAPAALQPLPLTESAAPVEHPPAARAALNPIRVAEWSLAAVLIALLYLTLRARRR